MRGAERPGRPNRSGPARRHSPDTHLCPKLYAVWPVLDAAQFDFELVLCRPHTFGVPLLCESWDNKREESQDELWSANSSKSGSGFKCPFAYACPVTERLSEDDGTRAKSAIASHSPGYGPHLDETGIGGRANTEGEPATASTHRP